MLTNVLQGGDGSRQPTAKELELAEAQGKMFWNTVAKVNFAWLDGPQQAEARVENQPEPVSKTTAAAPAPAPAPAAKAVPERTQKKKRDSEGPCGCTVA